MLLVLGYFTFRSPSFPLDTLGCRASPTGVWSETKPLNAGLESQLAVKSQSVSHAFMPLKGIFAGPVRKSIIGHRGPVKILLVS